MKEIPLNHGLAALVDDVDYPQLARYRWYAQPSHGTFYAKRAGVVDGRKTTVLMHCEIVKTSNGYEVDHWDGNGLNNLRSNLRPATRSQNHANRTRLSTNKSGRRGVHWDRYGWRAVIYRANKQIHLGIFADLDDAARAYDAAARELFGVFARPNFDEAAS